MGTPISDELAKRIRNGFTTDCADAIARKTGRRGVALLFDEHGNLDEVVDLNGGKSNIEVSQEGQHVTVEHGFEGWENPGPSAEHKNNPDRFNIEGTNAYRAVNEKSFPRMVEESHERSNRPGNNFEPVHTEGPRRSYAKQQTTSDAARRAKLTADAKREYQEGVARTERIAAQMKAASDKQWAGRR